MADKTFLRGVYRDTQNKCLNGKHSRVAINSSIKYTAEQLKTINMVPKFQHTTVEVAKQDTLVTAITFAQHKNKVCILNMASSYTPGGGVEKGSMAQEEELFRRTNYFLTLKSHFYRLLNGDVIYSPNVTIIKDENYADISPITMSFVASSALKYPDTTDDKYTPADKKIMINAIDNIFRAAYLNDKTILILGALGCGAYHNPQLEVIDIFNTCLQRYDRCFEHIIFAVYSKKDRNYDLFLEHIHN